MKKRTFDAACAFILCCLELRYINAISFRGEQQINVERQLTDYSCGAVLTARTSTSATFSLSCSIKTHVGLQYCIDNSNLNVPCVKVKLANPTDIAVPYAIQVESLVPSTPYIFTVFWGGGSLGLPQRFTTLAGPTSPASVAPSSSPTLTRTQKPTPTLPLTPTSTCTTQQGQLNACTQQQSTNAMNIGSFPGTIILGRPTDSSITFSLLSNSSIGNVTLSVSVAATGVLSAQKSIFSLSKNKALEVEIGGLMPNTGYTYTISFTQGSQTQLCPPHSFHTQRATGSTFLFSVMGDSHLGTLDHCDPVRYANTLHNVKSANPDFVIYIGDDFRADSVRGIPFKAVTNQTVTQLYLNQRPFMSIVAQDAALYNTNGNHECQEGWLLDSTCNNVPTWAITNRVEYYPNPAPNLFYQGDTSTNDCVYGGLQENYYSWSWGDALFVVLDDYLYNLGSGTTCEGGGGVGQGWGFSLGISQHLWLSSVLRTVSNFKFVFTHHVNGLGRGGIELVPFYEWGGYTPKKPVNSYDWATMRPASKQWTVPIQQMLTENDVTIVFQGHDHLFVKQGWPSEDNPKMLYVTAPFVASPNPDTFLGSFYDNSDAFESGVIRAPAGHLNVEVTSTSVTVSYILSSISPDTNYAAKNNLPTFQVHVEKSLLTGQIVVT